MVERRDRPLLVIQGLDDAPAPPGNGHALREQLGERVRVVDLPHAGHFMVLEQPEAIAGAVLEFLGVGAVGGYPHLISRGTIIPNEGWLDD